MLRLAGEFHAAGTFTGTATTRGVARTGTAEAVFNGVFAGPQPRARSSSDRATAG